MLLFFRLNFVKILTKMRGGFGALSCIVLHPCSRSREEREHRNKISANYDIFRYSDNTSWADPAVRAQERYEIPEASRQAEEETSNRAYAPAQSAPAW